MDRINLTGLLAAELPGIKDYAATHAASVVFGNLNGYVIAHMRTLFFQNSSSAVGSDATEVRAVQPAQDNLTGLEAHLERPRLEQFDYGSDLGLLSRNSSPLTLELACAGYHGSPCALRRLSGDADEAPRDLHDGS
jgi:hypothetical protein